MTQQFIFVTAASVHEKIMGEHLRTWSETEYTNAGEIMQNVGKIQEGDAKKRYQGGREGERERGGGGYVKRQSEEAHLSTYKQYAFINNYFQHDIHSPIEQAQY
jgi:hypothetical protein